MGRFLEREGRQRAWGSPQILEFPKSSVLQDFRRTYAKLVCMVTGSVTGVL